VQNSRTESKSVNLCGLKILVVDDSEDSRVLTSRILIKAGAEVITAQNGREGIKKALADEFSLVLMDMQMPDVDGIEATKELRQRGYRQPIIALTACALLEEKENSLRAGCDGHLTKPIVQERMLGTIADFCNQRTRRLEDPRANTEPLH
jgi:CheY-like chemotaxis protein